MTDPGLGERPRAAGLAHAATHRWDAAARRTVAACKRFPGAETAAEEACEARAASRVRGSSPAAAASGTAVP